MKNYIHNFDTTTERIIKRLPAWFALPMTLITQLGQPVVTIGLAMFFIGIGYKTNNTPLLTAGIVAVATTGVGTVLKLILRRNRPVTEYVERMFFHTYSFPSGHAASTVPIFGLLAYLLAGMNIHWSWVLLAIITPVLVGISRVYLGAHFASDVIGGWLLGIAGLAVIIFIVQPSL